MSSMLCGRSTDIPSRSVAVEGRIWPSPDADSGVGPAITSGRPALSRKISASSVSGSRSWRRAAAAIWSRKASVRAPRRPRPRGSSRRSRARPPVAAPASNSARRGVRPGERVGLGRRRGARGAGDPRRAELERIAVAEPERDRDRRHAGRRCDEQERAGDGAGYKTPVPHGLRMLGSGPVVVRSPHRLSLAAIAGATVVAVASLRRRMRSQRVSSTASPPAT